MTQNDLLWCVLILFYLTGFCWNFQKPKINSPIEIILDPNVDHQLECVYDKPINWTYPIPIDGTTELSQKLTKTTTGYVNILYIKNICYSSVGYYKCYATSSPDLSEYDQIYIYVKDFNHLSVNPRLYNEYSIIQYETVNLDCRPTWPEVNVSLSYQHGPKVVKLIVMDKLLENNGYYQYDPHIGITTNDTSENGTIMFICKFHFEEHEIELCTVINKMDAKIKLNKPDIIMDRKYPALGGDLTLTCEIGGALLPDITIITPTGSIDPERMELLDITKTEYTYSRNLSIKNLKTTDTGVYKCNVTFRYLHSSSEKYIKILEEDFINITEDNDFHEINTNAGVPEILFVLNVESYPEPTTIWFNNKNEKISSELKKYTSSFESERATLEIKDITISDYGNYTLEANNGFQTKQYSIFLNVYDKPTVKMIVFDYFFINTPYNISCNISANPGATFYWAYKICENCTYQIINNTFNITERINNIVNISTIQITFNQTGFIKCAANNTLGSDETVHKVILTDVKDGFDIFGLSDSFYVDGNDVTVAKGDQVVMVCGVSVATYTSKIQWFFKNQILNNDDISAKYEIEESFTEYSYRKTLKILDINFIDKGIYSCQANAGYKYVYKNISIEVKKPTKPVINGTGMVGKVRMKFPKSAHFNCRVWGVPKPTILWLKDNREIQFNERIKLKNNGQSLILTETELNDEGVYECRAENRMGITSRQTTLSFENKPDIVPLWVIIIIVLLLIAFLIACYFICVKMKRERRLKKQLYLAGLENFNAGAIENLNPDLVIDDQAELLPYNKKWEFPIEKLKLGKQLGSGAYGVVMKGKAKGILPNELCTTVAVKMVRSNAENSHLKALVSELKILIHLGQHVNVVNLLGACTKNIVKRELLIIVEFCRYGNLQNYLLRHRNHFIDQIDPNTGSIDYTIGQEFLKRTYSSRTSVHSPTSPDQKYSGVSFEHMNDYRGTDDSNGVNLISVTPHSNSQSEEVILTSNSSEQPEWRSNYRADDNGNPNKPISTKDLLVWSFQVARGMEYLASRKILHGDLAARNTLLADNNVVKICDFGLAKNIYNDDNYKKKSKALLPFKWMALESMRDRIFSTQSDVWSFGIVLWEFFSLAQTPYPGMRADEELYLKILNGYRLESPKFAPESMYKMMLDCWQTKPLARPSFSSLAERIGTLLEKEARKHYIDLNDPYLVMNTQRLEEGQNDYLAMVSPPDFDKLSSPHNYINENDDDLKEDDRYLSMNMNTVFSPRPDSETTFAFPNVQNRRPSSDGTSIELEPMLQPTTPSSITNPLYLLPTDLTTKDIIKSTDNYVNMPENRNTLQNNQNPFIKKNPNYVNEDVWTTIQT